MQQGKLPNAQAVAATAVKELVSKDYRDAKSLGENPRHTVNVKVPIIDSWLQVALPETDADSHAADAEAGLIRTALDNAKRNLDSLE